MLLLSAHAHAADEFSGVRCGTDVVKSLVGKQVSNEAAAQIETRHTDIQLKNQGGDEASSQLFLASWKICGREYMEMINKSSKITDVIETPHQPADAPLSIGRCGNTSAKAPVVVAILRNDGGIKDFPATSAWKVDEAKQAFVQIPVDGLRCPIDEIVTGD